MYFCTIIYFNLIKNIMVNNFKSIREDNRLLYEYVRGSTVYGTAIEGKSDIDTSGVFMARPETLFGLGLGYEDYVADERGDNSWYELVKWVRGLTTSNPTMLESLFIPDKFVLYKDPILTPFFENRDMFLTKQIFNPVCGYAIQQIKKARGLNKKIVNPISKKPEIFDECYVPRSDKNGSTNILNWLDYRGLKQKYCGCASLPNMLGCYEIFYDWGAHFKEEGITPDICFFHPEEYISTTELAYRLKNGTISEEEYHKRYKESQLYQMINFIFDFYGFKDRKGDICEEWLRKQLQLDTERHYRGIITEDSPTTEIRMSSIIKGDKRLTVMSYNKDGFSQACRKYKEYKVWEKERNPERYESNLDKSYDSKNLCHSFRILTMGQEILEGKGMIVDRREVGDEKFLLDIRNHKFEYDELIARLEEKEAKMKELRENSSLPDKIDINMVNDMLFDIQKEYIKKIL